MTIEDLDPDLVAPVKALNTRVAQLKAEVKDWEKRKAGAESEYAVVQRALDDLSSQRIEQQKQFNAERAELIKIQRARAEEQAAYDEAKRKILKLLG
jgi:hypothetical protein